MKVKIAIPGFLKIPSCKNGVIINERGFVDAKTGEILHRVNNLQEQILEFFASLKSESNAILKEYQAVFDASGIEGFTRVAGRPVNKKPAEESTETPEANDADTSTPDENQEKETSTETKISYSPNAIHTAKLAGIDISLVTGSGPDGKVVKGDVTAYIANLSKA